MIFLGFQLKKEGRQPSFKWAYCLLFHLIPKFQLKKIWVTVTHFAGSGHKCPSV